MPLLSVHSSPSLPTPQTAPFPSSTRAVDRVVRREDGQSKASVPATDDRPAFTHGHPRPHIMAIAPSRLCRALLSIFLMTAAATALSAGDGLHGDYFNAKTPPPVGTPGDDARVDPILDFLWSGDAPDGTTLVADDQYSIRWTGFVHASQAGSWTFKTVSNDGVRLWVNGTQLIDNWTQHAATLDTGSLSLPGAGWYPILVEYFNDGGTASFELRFEGPGQTDVVIPTSSLCTEYPGGIAPTADAGAVQVVPLGQSLTLSGAVGGSNGSVGASWTQVSGPAASIVAPNSASTQVLTNATGLHTFQLLASDSVGGFATDLVDVYVTSPTKTGSVSGTLRKWYPVTVDFTATNDLDERGSTNPFTSRRLQVHFVHPASDTVHEVPGYFAADGDAANTSATSGRTWRARFAPDRQGTWHYVAFFRSGADVALSLEHEAGSPAAFDSATGTVFVEATDPTAPGFFSKGRLQYVGGHHRRFSATGEPFLKTGTDSPENFLGYFEFDDTYDLGGQPSDLDVRDGLHHFDDHLADYSALGGGPTWKGGKGQRIVGALNYLADAGVNSIYFLTYNIDGGDGQEVFPWVDPTEKRRFDVSKLEQWALVLDHAQELGIHLHVVLQEEENADVLDGGGALGDERMLYYRELVARLGHTLALTWNLGEEYGGTSENLMDYADHLRTLDASRHPIKVHTRPDQIDTVYDPLFGDEQFEGASLQMDAKDTVWRTKQLRDDSADAGQPWVVEYDEQNPAGIGLVPDSVDPNHDDLRRDALWGNLLAGGGGVEWYFGYGNEHDDLDCEDFRSRRNMWLQAAQARQLLEATLPFEEMEPIDGLAGASDAQVLAERGEHYAVFRPSGGATTLDLEGSTDTFTVQWFDGKNGGSLRNGSVGAITGPGVQNLGAPPAGGLDWVAIVQRSDNRRPSVSVVVAEPTPFPGNTDLTIGAQVLDDDGRGDVQRVSAYVWSPQLTYLGVVDLEDVGGGTFAYRFEDLTALSPGTWWLLVTAVDSEGALGWSLGNFFAK